MINKPRVLYMPPSYVCRLLDQGQTKWELALFIDTTDRGILNASGVPVDFLLCQFELEVLDQDGQDDLYRR